MSGEEKKDQDEAAMVMAMNQLAEKYGCKVAFDFKTQTIDFDCPNKEAEIELALEIKRMFEKETSQ